MNFLINRKLGNNGSNQQHILQVKENSSSHIYFTITISIGGFPQSISFLKCKPISMTVHQIIFDGINHVKLFHLSRFWITD